MAKKWFQVSQEVMDKFLKGLESTRKPTKQENAMKALIRKRLEKWASKSNWSPVFNQRSWISMLA